MWQVSVGGQAWGTFSDAQITQMIQAGQLRDGWIAQVGTNQWMPLQQHAGFAAALRGGGHPGAPPGAPFGAHPGGPGGAHGVVPAGAAYPAPFAPGRPPPPTSSTGLVVGLVVGLLVLAGIGGAVVLAMAGADDDEPTRASAPPAPAAPVRTLDGVIAPRKAAIEAKLATALRIAAALPPRTSREVVAAADRGPIVLVVGTSEAIGKGEGLGLTPTATIVQVEDLQGQLTTRRDLTYGSGEALLHDCAAIVRNLPPASSFVPTSDLAVTEALLDRCVKLRQLAIIRLQKSDDPVVDQANSRYTPGIAEGDVLVFDIDSGKHLGGFRFTARNDPQMELSIADPRRDLVRDVRKKMWASISAGLTRAAPGAVIVNLY